MKKIKTLIFLSASIVILGVPVLSAKSNEIWQKSPNDCEGSAIRAYYNSTNEDCEKFCELYKGCIGYSLNNEGICLPKKRSCKFKVNANTEWVFYARPKTSKTKHSIQHQSKRFKRTVDQAGLNNQPK